MPLPATRVIGDGWEAKHSPVPEGAMTATCTAVRPASTPGQPAFDEVSGRSIYPTPPTVYAGPCRLQRGGTAATGELVGERDVTTRDYTLATPLTAPVLRVNDQVTIDTATDPAMVGTVLRITDVRGGTLLWQRDYIAEQWTPTTR